jgi:hypothetical protein
MLGGGASTTAAQLSVLAARCGATTTAAAAGLACRCSLVAIDFDETLTSADTCAILGSLAVASAPAGPQRVARRQRWDALVERFAEEYAATVPQLLPSPPLDAWAPGRFNCFVQELRCAVLAAVGVSTAADCDACGGERTCKGQPAGGVAWQAVRSERERAPSERWFPGRGCTSPRPARRHHRRCDAERGRGRGATA